MVDTVVSSTATTASIALGTSVYGKIDKLGDHDWYRIELEAGKTYEFRLHGMGIDEITDPFLRLRDADGKIIGRNDNNSSWTGFNAEDSRLIFTATKSGTYFVDAATYLDANKDPRNPSDAIKGDFLLTAVEQNTNGMVFTPDEIAWQLIDNGNAFFGDPPGAFDLGNDNSLTVNITALTDQGKAFARAALQAWTDVSGIGFVETTDVAEMVFDDDGSGASADYDMVGSKITNAWVNISTAWLGSDTTFDTYSFETYMHEIGHALGFGHGGNYNGSAVYGTSNFYLNDSVAYSIMSYMQAQGDNLGGVSVNTFFDADFRAMLTPAIADIIAIQNLYGDQVQTNTRTGNTTYGYNANTRNAVLDLAVTFGSDIFFCVYDDGGQDRLDFSQAAVAQTINLNAERPSNVLGGLMNLWIARNTVVENAIGGTEADAITGNAVANNLRGLAGADTLKGRNGHDLVTGGLGIDSLYGGKGRDKFIFNDGDSDASRLDADTIFDFRGSKGDSINLRLVDAEESTMNDQKFHFIGTRRFSGDEGELRYQSSNGETWVLADTDGDKKSDFTLHFDDALTLKGEYFQL